MTIKEKETLKIEYRNLKEGYHNIKEEMLLKTKYSPEYNEYLEELEMIKHEIWRIRCKLIDAKLSIIYPTTIMENFIDEKPILGGRR